MQGSKTAELQSAESLLALMSIPTVGPVTALKLARHFPTWDSLLGATEADRKQVGGTAGLAVAYRPEPPAYVNFPESSIRGYFDDDYPSAFESLASPPAVIWMRGELSALPSVAVVGTRRPTPPGANLAEVVARDAVGAAAQVVSGLAKGVAVAAHRGCLDAGGTTVAVLGAGLDKVGSVAHQKLSDQIVNAGGVVITEQPPGTRADSGKLIARNRLQVALSQAVVVVQSSLLGGTLETARQALLQHRLLACCPPATDDDPDAWAGNVALLDPQRFSLFPRALARALLERGPAIRLDEGAGLAEVLSQATATERTSGDPTPGPAVR